MGIKNNGLEQDEKVILFTNFVNTVERFVKHFGDQSVVVSGEVPAEQRQGRVDRFQNDDSVRVFIANLHVGGVGLNLTAGRQVVFNDLDWVPANHWQAEDRAYRIGQTAPVNVTYIIAGGTIDEFVKTVLETKAKLTEELVEGKALGEDLQTDVISELKRMMNALFVQSTDAPPGVDGEGWMMTMLRDASDAYIEENASHLSESTRQQLVPYSQEAIRTLAKVLTGPVRTAYQVESASTPGTFYQLDVVGEDITCDCAGFTHRGTCRHVRPLKTALVSGKPLPKGYTKVT